MNELDSIERELTEALVKVLVRYPDGLDRIETIVVNVLESAQELGMSFQILEPGDPKNVQ